MGTALHLLMGPSLRYVELWAYEYSDVWLTHPSLLAQFAAPIAEDIARIRDMVEADCHTIDPARPQNSEFDSLTFEAYLRSRGATEEAILTATVWTRAMLGQDPRDISALYFLTYCKSGGGLLQMRSDRKGGGQHLRLRQGTQMIANGLADALPSGTVRLSTAVSAITQDGTSDVEVVTANQQTLRTRKVISTVPSPVLKDIAFTPKLPPSKQLWAESSCYGYYTKAMMVFKTPFWVENGYCGLTQSFRGPASVIRDTSSPPDNKHVLTCFMSGDPGRAWAALPTREREEALVQQIGSLYGAEVEASRDFIEMVTYEWINDVYAGWGCPCPALAPGVLDILSGGIRDPFNNVHFAGTETAIEWRGYMEGALRSGERAAAEVVKDLTSGLSSRL